MRLPRLLFTITLSLCATAAQAEIASYSCDNGQLAVKTSTALTLEEWTVVVGLDVAQRPDYGHYVFERPDGKFIWARTSTMEKICQERAECAPASAAVTGLAVGPLVRRTASGGVELCELPPTEATMVVCYDDGSTATSLTSNDPAHLQNFFGLPPQPDPSYVIWRETTGPSQWSALSPEALATQCVPKPAGSNTLNDGIWFTTLRESTADGCPPQALAQGEAIGAQFAQDVRFDWPTPFTPAAMIPDDDFARGWEGDAPRWSAVAVNQDHGTVRVSVAMNYAIQTPDHVIVDAQMDLIIAAGLPTQCRYFATFDIRRRED